MRCSTHDLRPDLRHMPPLRRRVEPLRHVRAADGPHAAGEPLRSVGRSAPRVGALVLARLATEEVWMIECNEIAGLLHEAAVRLDTAFRLSNDFRSAQIYAKTRDMLRDAELELRYPRQTQATGQENEPNAS